MNTGETQGYVLTFRCINCGKYEVFVNYRTEHIVHEDRIRDRIYQVRCNSCGWSGHACGLLPFVFPMRRNSRRGLRDRNLGCDATADLPRVWRLSIDKRWPKASTSSQCKVVVRPV